MDKFRRNYGIRKEVGDSTEIIFGKKEGGNPHPFPWQEEKLDFKPKMNIILI